MSSSLRLECTFAASSPTDGVVRMRLVNAGNDEHSRFLLGFTSYVQLTPPEGAPVQLVRCVGSYHELAPMNDVVLAPGQAWDVGPLESDLHLVHANDGPVAALLVADDGSAIPIDVVPTTKAPTVTAGDSSRSPAPLRLATPTDVASSAWATAAACEARLHPDDPPVLSNDGTEGDDAGGDALAVEARLDDRLEAEAFQITAGGDTSTVVAGSPFALQWAFMAIARWQRGDGQDPHGTFRPRHGYRGVMIDLARHFYPASDVSEMIDLAAWRRLNTVHLHLTDDQGWRFPVPAHPTLTDIGAWRGHGLRIPPAHASGADAYGGSYTVDDIRSWVTKAAELGIRLIPEIDVPGHGYAAITSLPELRDPDDTSTTLSVQHFPHNVLNPGVPATRPFLEAVFGELADRFPGSPIHIGGDEIPEGTWAASPAARRYAEQRGLTTHGEIAAAFVRDIIDVVAATTGRRLVAWQEAATCGGMRPDDGMVIGWTSSAACKALAAAGFEVVAAPAHACYLDMATGPDWHLPGMWWAGHITTDVIERFDVTDDWSDSERSHLAGVQACLWGEHAPAWTVARDLLLPRLDAFAGRAWEVTAEPAS